MTTNPPASVRRSRAGRGDVRDGSTWARRVGMAGAVLLASSALMPVATVAADARPGTADTVEECRRTGQVWLLVVTETGERLRSECVGRPDTGGAALALADVTTTQSTGGYLCTLAGHPQVCPRSFDGTYWQYWQSAGPGAAWVHSARGAGSSTVTPGSVEGWCRNAEGEEYCDLPVLSPGDVAAARVDVEPERAGRIWPAALGVVVLVGATVVARRRRAQTSDQ